MNRIQCNRLFSPVDSWSSGAITYIISKHSQYPAFSRNDDNEINKNQGFSYDPRLTYSKNTSIAFNTKEDIIPYHIIDIYPYTITPFSYSLAFPIGNSPAVQWEISGSNDRLNWEILSSPPLNNSVCIALETSICANEVSLLYSTSIPILGEKQFRYLRYRVLRDRAQEYYNQTIYLMRIRRLEFYGLLFGGISCHSSKTTSFHYITSLLLIIILFKS